MKSIQYFSSQNLAPEGAEYLCVQKRLVKDDGYKMEYEEIFVYEIPSPPKAACREDLINDG